MVIEALFRAQRFFFTTLVLSGGRCIDTWLAENRF